MPQKNFVDEVASELDVRLDSLSSCIEKLRVLAPSTGEMSAQEFDADAVSDAFKVLRGSLKDLATATEKICDSREQVWEQREEILKEERSKLDSRSARINSELVRRREKIDEDFLRLRAVAMQQTGNVDTAGGGVGVQDTEDSNVPSSALPTEGLQYNV